MSAIFRANEADVPWGEYVAATSVGEPPIRFKALTPGTDGVPPVQLIEYPPNHTDSIHHHNVGEVFIVTDGELWMEDARTGPGGIAFVPPRCDYAVRAGAQGVRYFRVVVPTEA